MKGHVQSAANASELLGPEFSAQAGHQATALHLHFPIDSQRF